MCSRSAPEPVADLAGVTVRDRRLRVHPWPAEGDPSERNPPITGASTTPELQLELPARPESVTAARHAAGEIGFQLGCDAVAVRIAISEAVGNAVVHAYREPDESGPILVLGRVLRRRLILTVADQGCGMSPHFEARRLGIGLPVISKVCLDVRIESDRAGTAVAMSFAVASSFGDGRFSDDAAAAAASEAELERARQLIRSLGGKAHLRADRLAIA